MDASTRFSVRTLIEQLKTDWKHVLLDLVDPYSSLIDEMLSKDIESYTSTFILPEKDNIFRCFNYFDIKDMKAMILGQDPYHTLGVADGLCFSAKKGSRMPPSLRNIFKELEHNYNASRDNTELEDWAQQGVLLLNTALTVVVNTPESHLRVWNSFIHDILAYIGKNTGIVVMLWGNKARAYSDLFNNCYVLQHSHPSPLARASFIGNNHFIKCNEYLIQNKKKPIKWL